MTDQNYISDDAIQCSIDNAAVLPETRAKKNGKKRGKKRSQSNEKPITKLGDISNITTEHSAEDTIIGKEILSKQSSVKTLKKLSKTGEQPAVSESSISEESPEKIAKGAGALNRTQPKRKTRKQTNKPSKTESDTLPQESFISDDTTVHSADDTLLLKETKPKRRVRRRGKKMSESNEASILSSSALNVSNDPNNQLPEETIVSHKQTNKSLSAPSKAFPQNAYISDDTTEQSADDTILLKETEPRRRVGKRGKKMAQSSAKPIISSSALNISSGANDQLREETAVSNKQTKKLSSARSKTLSPPSFISDDTIEPLTDDSLLKEPEPKRRVGKRGKKISKWTEELIPSPSASNIENDTKDQLDEKTVQVSTETKPEIEMKLKENDIKPSSEGIVMTDIQSSEHGTKRGNKVSLSSEEKETPSRKKQKKDQTETQVNGAPTKKDTKEVTEKITKENKVTEPPTKNKTVTMRTPAPRKSISNIKMNVSTSKKPLQRTQSVEASTLSLIPKLAKAKAAPNFSEIHKKNFMKMQSVDEYVEKKQVRSAAVTASAKSFRTQPMISTVSATPSESVKSRLFPTPASEKPPPIKFNFVSGIQKPVFTAQGLVASGKKRMMATLKENHQIVPTVTTLKKTSMGAGLNRSQQSIGGEMLRGVRVNRRFQLQMQHRNMKH